MKTRLRQCEGQSLCSMLYVLYLLQNFFFLSKTGTFCEAQGTISQIMYNGHKQTLVGIDNRQQPQSATKQCPIVVWLWGHKLLNSTHTLYYSTLSYRLLMVTNRRFLHNIFTILLKETLQARVKCRGIRLFTSDTIQKLPGVVWSCLGAWSYMCLLSWLKSVSVCDISVFLVKYKHFVNFFCIHY